MRGQSGLICRQIGPLEHKFFRIGLVGAVSITAQVEAAQIIGVCQMVGADIPRHRPACLFGPKADNLGLAVLFF